LTGGAAARCRRYHVDCGGREQCYDASQPRLVCLHRLAGAPLPYEVKAPCARRAWYPLAAIPWWRQLRRRRRVTKLARLSTSLCHPVATTETQSSSCSLPPLSSSSCSWLPPVPPSNGDDSLHAEENANAPVVARTRPARNRTVRVRVEVVMNGQTTCRRERGNPVSPTGPF
jgi:hypothetical protein